ncbi:histone-like nucleoid-structuring protein Lsr2 [Streptomyces sp. NPDC001822]|uniref:Lsr2 family DNA-binding protein n=1 Tax=Streptomyces sp. NPDC001822 TaxID=3364614 RepID=UPI0036BA3B5C
MYLTNDWLVEAAADARRRKSESTVWVDTLTARLHGNMHFNAALALANSRVERYLEMNDLQESPDLIREHLILWKVREEGDRSALLSPEIRLFNARYPAHLRKVAEEKARREESKRIAAESRKSAERAAHRTWLMKDMREWGRKNGHFVGTRGSIPRKVIDAYTEAKGK